MISALAFKILVLVQLPAEAVFSLLISMTLNIVQATRHDCEVENIGQQSVSHSEVYLQCGASPIFLH